VRHAILAAVFLTLAMLPAAAWLAPQVKIPVRIEPPRAGPQPFARVRFARVDGRVIATPPSRGPSTAEILLAIWAAGAAIFLAPVAFGLWQARRLRRHGLPWQQGQSMADRLAAELRLGRSPMVLLNEELAGPVTCGVARAAILLPVDAVSWNEEDLERAMRHELEHVRRGDWMTHVFARAVCGAYWFHPLAWIARSRMELEAERACDDAVVESSEATAYADQLLALARRLSGPAKSPVLGMASRADLAVRIGAVLDARQKRGRAQRWQVALACAVAAAGLAIAPLRVVAAPQGQSYQGNSNLVMEDVTVTDAGGKAIEGLKASDFAVTEDGVGQQISIFEFQKVDDSPVPSYYLLGYYATRTEISNGVFRRVKVTLTNGLAARLDFRGGYYWAKQWPKAGTPQGNTQPTNTAGRGAARREEKPGVFGAVGSGEGVFGSAGSSGAPSQGVSGATGSGGGAGRVDGAPGIANADAAQAADGITDPIPVYKPEPEYSDEARKAKLQGSVAMLVTIDENGKVTNAKVLRSLGLGLDEKAIEAVLKWRFRPATQGGKTITVTRTVLLNFRLL
jgi:TonB family protein